MIEADRLTKRFGAFTAISDVSFRVEPGEVVGFLGPNGAGKSTTMRILCGVFPPTSGHASVAGFDVATQSLQARQIVGYFPERVALYLDMTVREYLRYVAQMKGIASRSQASEIERVMTSCGVSHMAHRLIGTLSKGYRQRTGIAQAIIGRPKVLILDEPTSGLDPEQVAEMRHLIRGLKGESTVILSTHILSEVEATCDRVIIINKGRIVAVDTPAGLNHRLRAASQIHLEVVAAAADIQQRLAGLAGVARIEVGDSGHGTAIAQITATPDTDIRAVLAREVAAAGWGLLELRPVTLSLEDIFISLVHAEAGAQNHNEIPSRLSA